MADLNKSSDLETVRDRAKRTKIGDHKGFNVKEHHTLKIT